MVKISLVEKGSPADKAGLLAGDSIISINGNPINDGLDYYFYTTDRRLIIEAERDGKPFTLKLSKGEYDALGAEFDSYLITKQKRCRNNCMFCFIDQNPKGMRESIYFKDDDERLSFLHGNYVTLTNLSDEDIARIIKMRISPVNVSVHTMNPELRCTMMGNRFAGKCLDYLTQLSEHGIAINAQLVLCPQINDGKELVYSMEQLYKLKSLQSVSAVPVGLTAHREGLPKLRLFTAEEAAAVIKTINEFTRLPLKEKGVRMFYASDEFYLTAGIPIPPEDEYDGYPQLENGVGMLRCHREEFMWALEGAAESHINPTAQKVFVATGYAAYGHICALAEALTAEFPQVDCRVFAVENRFFGNTVTVSGLVTGGDLIEELKGAGNCDKLIIPCNMLRSEGDLFLDGVSLKEAEARLGYPIEVAEKDGADLLYKLLNISEEDIV
ncbi:MAG: DUF512 domain-containing protein [Clostridia bacterium]|nr:DUF512 domain-containing protein [Clostridia bacterium]